MDKSEQMTHDLSQIVRILEKYTDDYDIMEILEAAAFELEIDRERFAQYILETLGKGA
jgi:6-pyruvoyl-tetrahydropterin synthase